MNLVDAVPIVVASILTVTVIHGDVSITPLRQSVIDGVFIGVDHSRWGDSSGDKRLYGALLNVVT
jgi:hypothetical protein